MQRAAPAKTIIESRYFPAETLAEMAGDGRLLFADRRTLSHRHKDEWWDAYFISRVVVGIQPGHIVIDMRSEPYRVLVGSARVGAAVDFLNGAILCTPNADLDEMSLWDFGSLGEKTIKRRVREATFSASCIMPGTGDLEFEAIKSSMLSD
ncbi:MAG: hypothetical protein IKZ87_01305 [Actinomycetaceae bacterium]|nr:hypothetical protein [Actinomycetaceae bacterium]